MKFRKGSDKERISELVKEVRRKDNQLRELHHMTLVMLNEIVRTKGNQVGDDHDK